MYILEMFKYRKLGDVYTKRMKKAMESLKILPKAHSKIGLKYRGYDIYMKPYHTYLFFYCINEMEKTIVMDKMGG